MKTNKAVVRLGGNPAFIRSVFAALKELGVGAYLIGSIDSMIQENKGDLHVLIQPYPSTTLSVAGQGSRQTYIKPMYDNWVRLDATTQFAELIEFVSPKTKQIAFWSYDRFPYVFSADLTGQSSGTFSVRGYGTLPGKPLAIMDEVSAKDLNDSLSDLKSRRENSIAIYDQEIRKLIPWRKL